MNKFILLSTAILTACTTVESVTRVSIDVSASEFNSVYSAFYERPTFGSIVQVSDGSESLSIVMDAYGQQMWTVFFDRKYLDEYRSIINKFLEWETIATQQGDVLTKIIDSVPGGGTLSDQTYKFTFHSGKTGVHYLAITHCTSVMCVEQSTQYYDVENARKLMSALDQFDLELLRSTSKDRYQ